MNKISRTNYAHNKPGILLLTTTGCIKKNATSEFPEKSTLF